MFIPTMQAIGLGGGSLINSAICARAPAFAFDKWARKDRHSSSRARASRLTSSASSSSSFVEPTPLEVQGERNLRLQARLRRPRLSPASPRGAT
jgi:hypothetical protein